MTQLSASRIYRQTRMMTFFIISSALLLFGCSQPGNTDNNEDKSPRTIAINYLQEYKFDEAKAAFEKAIKADPGQIANYIDLGQLYLGENNLASAEKFLQDGLTRQPENKVLELLMAEIYNRKGDRAQAIKLFSTIAARDDKNVEAIYKLALFAGEDDNILQQKQYLVRLTEIIPANIIPRLQLAEISAKQNLTDSALHYLQSLKKIAGAFPASADSAYLKATTFLQRNDAQQALYYLMRLHELMKTSKEFATSQNELELSGWLAGSANFTTSQYNQVYDKSRIPAPEDFLFSDASEYSGLFIKEKLNAKSSVLAVADYDVAGNIYAYTSFLNADANDSKHYLFLNNLSAFTEITLKAGIDHSGQETDAVFFDYDNDGFPDLFIATSQGIVGYKNIGDGAFSRLKNTGSLAGIKDANRLLVADLDQDGDLDIYVAAKGRNKFLRNNNDGTFSEQAALMGLEGSANGTIDLAFTDWDTDGDLDIAALTTDGSLELYRNNRYSKFENATASSGIKNNAFHAQALAFGDYNNDGLPDLLIAGSNSSILLHNSRDGFITDPVSGLLSAALKDVSINAVLFTDFDNDGHEDIFMAGTTADGQASGLRLFHNDTTKGFSDFSRLLPSTITQGQRIGVADFNLDGDDDIFVSGPYNVYLARNDGGNLNHYMQVQLVGLTLGNSKNNRFGIGALVELRSGNLYQQKMVTRSLMNFGVGMRDSLDAVRIIWPNGTPQLILDPSRREKLIEEEKLKGSCPFLYAWNGEKYEFVKDMMWRSALGMPLAFGGKDTVFAFSDASKEYLLIPGEKIQPQDGRYIIKITEELWETVYFDQAVLTAVDHPDSIDVFADEKFTLPPFPGKYVYTVSKKHQPRSATDETGNDLLPKLNAYDFNFVSGFTPGKFQGLTETHELILDLGPDAKSDSLFLFLRGWTFPSDASISTSVAQSKHYPRIPPSLQVKNKKGEWQTVVNDIGYPMGKDKMVVVDLTKKFLTSGDRRVRIVTNLQIYWDEVFYSTGNTGSPVRMSDLKMKNANLDFRGYSASFRKNGPFGPHWFDYYNVSTGQKWRDLTGNYTRFGDVLPLLTNADDEYIIANSGDEITIEFDATSLPALPKGWKRDFLIYSVGWVKDGDLNTVHGQTVEPLPFHTMQDYPYGERFSYPAAQHKAYLQQYNTRKVTTDDFRNALKPRQ